MKSNEDVIDLLTAIKNFRVNDELPFNTVDYMQIDSAIEYLQAADKSDELPAHERAMVARFKALKDL